MRFVRQLNSPVVTKLIVVASHLVTERKSTVPSCTRQTKRNWSRFAVPQTPTTSIIHFVARRIDPWVKTRR